MNLVTNYITEIIGAVATITAYFVGVKKDKADAFITMQKSYKTFADDMNLKYEFMRESIESMRKDNERLEQENKKLRTRLNKYEKE
jgi:regulator of replication initiation timing